MEPNILIALIPGHFFPAFSDPCRASSVADSEVPFRHAWLHLGPVPPLPLLHTAHYLGPRQLSFLRATLWQSPQVTVSERRAGERKVYDHLPLFHPLTNLNVVWGQFTSAVKLLFWCCPVPAQKCADDRSTWMDPIMWYLPMQLSAQKSAINSIINTLDGCVHTYLLILNFSSLLAGQYIEISGTIQIYLMG